MDAESLLAHRDLVARIARGLLHDEGLAEDVVQETFVAALERPPASRASLRGWLARVARNRAVDALRRARRRRALPRIAVAPSPGPSEIAERLLWQQRVVDALLALEEPYRETLLLRFYEDLPPREVARRLAVPVNTARTRIRRGLDLVRGHLDRAAGGRAHWSASLAPLLLPAAKGAAMKKAVLAILVLALVGSYVSVRVLRREQSGGGPGAEATRAGVRPAATAAAEGAIAEGEARVTGYLGFDLPPDCAANGGVLARVYGGGALLREARLPGGAFRLSYERGVGEHHLRLSGERLVAARFDLPRERTDLGEIRLRRATSYGGKVLDLEGRPLEGVVITFAQDGSFHDGEPSGADGAYRIEVPGSVSLTVEPNEKNLYRVLLYARRGGAWGGPYYATRRGFDLSEDLRIRLEADPVFRFTLGRGRAGLAGATVRLHGSPSFLDAGLGPVVSTSRTDADGRVSLSWPPWVETGHLVVEGAEGEKVFLTVPRGEALGSETYEVPLGPDDTVRLRLRVEDSAPTAGVRVRVEGLWSPDGYPAQGGVTDVLLAATVPESGEIEWCFVGERRGESVFFPRRWVCEDARKGVPRMLQHLYDPERPLVVRAGGMLDPIRLGEGNESHGDFLLAAFSVPVEEAPVCWISSPGGNGTYLKAQSRVREGADGWLFYVKQVREEWDADETGDIDLCFMLSGPRIGKVHVTTKQLGQICDEGAALPVSVASAPTIAHVRVLDPDGAPVRGALVQASPPDPLDMFQLSSAVTDSEGRAEVPYDPAAGPWIVHAVDRATGAGLRIPEWWDGGRERTIRLERARAVSFRLAFDATAKPPERVRVHITSSSYDLAPYHDLRLGADGFYRTPPVAPSLYRLQVWAFPGGRLFQGLPLAQIEEGGTVEVR